MDDVTRVGVAGLMAAAALTLSPALGAPALGTTTADRPTDGTTLEYADPRYDDAATISLEGTLQSAVLDPADGHDHDDEHVVGYAVRTDDGALVEVPASFAADAPASGRFEGELAITADLAADLRDEGVTVRPGRTIDGDTSAGATALAVAADQAAPVPVASATVAAPVASAVATQAHRAYVAVITNRGTIEQSDAQVAATVDAMTGYWVTESDGAIPSFPRVSTVKYASGVAGSTSNGCGMSDPWDVWDEAAGKFPGVDWNQAGTHLVVVTADDCRTGSAGVGTVGYDLHSGGAVTITLGSAATHIGAHEIGHNAGLGHANASICSSSSCSTIEYRNLHSVMGIAFNDYAPAALDTAYRVALGLSTSDEVRRITLPTGEAAASTSVRLAPRGGSSGVRGLEVVDPVSGATSYVDLRSGTGRDAAAAYSAGRWSLSGVDFRTGVTITQITPDLDTTLFTRRSGSSSTSSYGAGTTFTRGGVTVDVSTVSSTGADVVVTLVKPGGGGPLVSAVPTLDGAATVGSPVTALPGTWTDGVTFAYQWKLAGKAVSGATGPTYTPVAGDVGKALTVTVTGSKPGFTSVSLTSQPATVTAAQLTAPTPTVSGSPAVGSKVTAVPGSWTSGTKLTYRWRLDGSSVSKATSSTYTPVAKDLGKTLTVTVTGTKSGFATVSRTSAGAVVAAGTLTAPTPTISGTVRSGKTLTAKTSGWTSSVTKSYRWLADGEPISGATKSTYKISSSMVGKRISVRVTGTKSGYTTVVVTSGSTATVTK